VGTYFGRHARDLLERAYEAYQQVGSDLEDAYRKVAHGGQGAALDGLDGRLGEAGRHRIPVECLHDDPVA